MSNLLAMATKEYLTNQVQFVLSNISHPLEGTFYLFVLAVIFRWRWPKTWNNFLKSVSARTENSTNTDSNSAS